MSSISNTEFETTNDVVVVNVSTKKELEQKPPFQLLENDGIVRIQVLSEQLRRFIWDQMDDQTLIHPNYHLYAADDSNDIKQTRDRNSQFPIEAALTQWTDWYDNLGTESLFNAVYERHEPIITEIRELGVVLQHERDKLVAETTNVLSGKDDVTFSRLYFALKETDLSICVEHNNTIISGKVSKVLLEPAGFFNSAYIKIQIKIHSHDGATVVVGYHSHTIYEYYGEQNVTDLGIVVMTDEINQYLLDRGRKYIKYTENPGYVAYTGVVTRRSYWGSTTFRAKGRAMIDVQAMKSIDSNYDWYFAMGDRGRDSNTAPTKFEISDEILMSTSPYVYGFSFSAKVWGEMLVDEIFDISFREDAYDMLVLPSDVKDMLVALVEDNDFVGQDFIDGKGGGCIFLLAGPPGVGKTLTAEAIAEKLQKPLYMVGIGELGTNVQELEKSLRDILDIAASWDAVLLLDEADIFMEARNDADVERNAMVGVFLRMLEYYQGTLFLTTNRAQSIDDAFYSRISLAIKYDNLTEESRRIIWANVLTLNGFDDSIDVNHLAEYKVNGRQIKNITKIVRSLGRSSGQAITTNDFQSVINHIIKFNDNE